MTLDNSGSDVNCFDFRIRRLALNKSGFRVNEIFQLKNRCSEHNSISSDTIGHFRVLLCFKTSLSAKPFI